MAMSGSMATGCGMAAVITGIMAIGPGRGAGVAGLRVTGIIRIEDIAGTAVTGDKPRSLEINELRRTCLELRPEPLARLSFGPFAVARPQSSSFVPFVPLGYPSGEPRPAAVADTG